MPVTNEQAQAALDVLLAYIEQHPVEHVYKDVEESTATNEVRDWCYQLPHKSILRFYQILCGEYGELQDH